MNTLQPGTVVILQAGKKAAEDRWQLASELQTIEGYKPCYSARRWIKKNAKWSGTSYLIGADQIVRVE